jgi:hypothetical protein
MKKSFSTILLTTVLAFCACGQELNGIVTDEHRNRLIAISVIIKGTGTGTITNVCGQFSIPSGKDDFTVVFHGVSYDDLRVYEVKMKKSELTNDTIVFQLGHLKAYNPKCKRVDRKLKRVVIE